MVENHYSFTDDAGSSEGKELERELRRLFKGDFPSLRACYYRNSSQLYL